MAEHSLSKEAALPMTGGMREYSTVVLYSLIPPVHGKEAALLMTGGMREYSTTVILLVVISTSDGGERADVRLLPIAGSSLLKPHSKPLLFSSLKRSTPEPWRIECECLVRRVNRVLALEDMSIKRFSCCELRWMSRSDVMLTSTEKSLTVVAYRHAKKSEQYKRSLSTQNISHSESYKSNGDKCVFCTALYIANYT